MSTKAIREALKVLSDSYQEATGATTVPGEVVAALSEVEAIERLAKDYCGVLKEPIPVRDVIAMMKSIAKDAP
jgi:hypothetical protein